MSLALQRARSQYWRRTLRLSFALLSAWLLVTLVVCLWAPQWLWTLFGWPVGFWVSAQGVMGFYVLLVGGYAWAMDGLDAAHAEAGDD